MLMIMDLMHLSNFHCQIVNELKMLLFLEFKTVLPRNPNKEKKYLLFLGEGPTGGLDDVTINIL